MADASPPQQPEPRLTGESLYREFWRMRWVEPTNIQRWELLPSTEKTVWAGLAAFAARAVEPPLPVDPEHPEYVCGRCGGPNLLTWHASSPLWNAVMRREESEPYDGIICPTCFGQLARQAGVADHFCLTTHNPKVDLPTTFGDGRVWDAGQCQWVPAPSVPLPVDPERSCMGCGQPTPEFSTGCMEHPHDGLCRRCVSAINEILHDSEGYARAYNDGYADARAALDVPTLAAALHDEREGCWEGMGEDNEHYWGCIRPFSEHNIPNPGDHWTGTHHEKQAGRILARLSGTEPGE